MEILSIQNYPSKVLTYTYLVTVSTTCAAPQKSLGEEVNELTSSRLLKLEKDNQTLLKTVEELRGAAGQDASGRLAKANQENQRLTQKVGPGPWGHSSTEKHRH